MPVARFPTGIPSREVALMILDAGRFDTNPKRQRGNGPRWRFGLVSDYPARSILFTNSIYCFRLTLSRRIVYTDGSY
jgi:hypothetical protein